MLTVVAMVSVIPMVNQLVILIALWKYQPCPDKEYEQVASIVGKGILDTELVITSKTDKSFYLIMRVFMRKVSSVIVLIRMYQKKDS